MDCAVAYAPDDYDFAEAIRLGSCMNNAKKFGGPFSDASYFVAIGSVKVIAYALMQIMQFMHGRSRR